MNPRKPLLAASVMAGVVAPAPCAAQKTLVAVFAHPDDERIVAPLLALRSDQFFGAASTPDMTCTASGRRAPRI